MFAVFSVREKATANSQLWSFRRARVDILTGCTAPHIGRSPSDLDFWKAVKESGGSRSGCHR